MVLDVQGLMIGNSKTSTKAEETSLKPRAGLDPQLGLLLSPNQGHKKGRISVMPLPAGHTRVQVCLEKSVANRNK